MLNCFILIRVGSLVLIVHDVADVLLEVKAVPKIKINENIEQEYAFNPFSF